MSQTFTSITEYPGGAVCPGLPVTAMDIKVYNNVGMALFYHTTDAGTTSDVIVNTYYVFTDKDGTETEVQYDTDTWNAGVAAALQLRVQKYTHKVDHLRVKITQTGTGGGAIRISANVSKGA